VDASGGFTRLSAREAAKERVNPSDHDSGLPSGCIALLRDAAAWVGKQKNPAPAGAGFEGICGGISQR